jgi:hypothetical protein
MERKKSIAFSRSGRCIDEAKEFIKFNSGRTIYLVEEAIG